KPRVRWRRVSLIGFATRASCPGTSSGARSGHWSSCRSALDGDASPERDVVQDVGRGVLWRWIVPGRIAVRLAIHDDVVIAGFALPRARRVSATVAHVLPLHGIRREVHVAFDDLYAVTLREDLSLPSRTSHARKLTVLLVARTLGMNRADRMGAMFAQQ